ncbi:major facilitator superfamily domain-containing protein [Halteromyces radiatus]|uniref:major facilitator superfamily domain-containing protein n=1 Tax=Halteromyces radiatus TaxID=101107 RepID=UPI00221EC026|nr:major facilitator superfamily domain-containing protein [Halteromyces radiatus]KAI8086095.1 major facilitator superfamily domain-containing protein [Halteromyces radiatus]
MTTVLLPKQHFGINNNMEETEIPTASINSDDHIRHSDETFDDVEQPMLPSTSFSPSNIILGNSLILKILYLTLSLAGLQFTWSVEMAYGTPYLLSLGLSKSHMSLVWIAGPLSGLVMQPIVGAFSDKCTSKWGRRRPFLLIGSIMVVISLVVIGWTREITEFFVSSDEIASFKKLSIGIAITAIYILDFSINCVQASCRALIVDSLPPSQQEKGTAWAGRMVGLGNVIGYFMGYVDLVKIFPFFGNTQLKVLCVFASIVLLLCDAITCYTVKEKVLSKEQELEGKISHFKTFTDIASNLWYLPLTVRRICNVQFFAWIGWFPFLFYSTTWVAEIYDRTALQHQPSNENGSVDTVGQATRAGSLAFLVYSMVSLSASFFIPLLVTSSYNNDDDGTSHGFTVRGKHFTISPSKYIRYLQCVSLPRMWTISHFIFCFAMFSTVLVSDVVAASLVIGICGISWAVTMWAPFSLLGEYIAQCEQMQQQDNNQQHRNDHQYNPLGMQQQEEAWASRINLATGSAGMGLSGNLYHLVEEGNPLLDRDDYIPLQPYNKHDEDGDRLNIPRQEGQENHVLSIGIPSASLSSSSSSTSSLSSLSHHQQSTQNDLSTIPSAGIILGIHNMYIVLPQFLVTFFSSLLFHFLEKKPTDIGDGVPSDTIGVVLRFGAVMAAIAGFLSLKLGRSK